MRPIGPVCLILCLALSIAVCAQEFSGVGAFFSLGSSARALGLGRAFAALADDEGAVLHNPAALASYEGFGASSVFVRQFGGITYGAATFATSYFGGLLALLDSGRISSGDGTLRYASQGIVLGGGLPLGPFGFGVRWRFLNVSAPSSGSGWALDPCMTFTTESLRVAMLLESALSTPVRYESGSVEGFAPSLTIGTAATLAPAEHVEWNLVFQADGLITASTRLAMGLETWVEGLGARVGYDGQGVTYGLSARLLGLQLDWAYAMRSDLGGSHRVGLTLRW